LGDISQSTPQTASFEVMETEVAIEGCGSVVGRVNDDGPCPELLAAPDAPAQSVDQKVTA
jgi:peptide methionine sulfoxide reductase MsrB